MKTHELAAAFLEKTHSPSPSPVRTTINAFQSLFAVQELPEEENRAIERILIEGSLPGALAEPEVDRDALEIKRITKELKAIQRQELILIGERIASAREVFKNYGQKSFREWLQLTFHSFKSGYNYLALYDLYVSLPSDLQGRLKDMPAKAAYILASNKAPLEQKLEIVRGNAQKSATSWISLIRRTLGNNQARRSLSENMMNSRIIGSMEREASLLLPDRFDEEQRRRLTSLVAHLKELIKHSAS